MTNKDDLTKENAGIKQVIHIKKVLLVKSLSELLTIASQQHTQTIRYIQEKKIKMSVNLLYVCYGVDQDLTNLIHFPH